MKEFSVNNLLVIKEQKALCYMFINKIECLHAFKDDDIAPILYDAYVCIEPENKDRENIKHTICRKNEKK